jgi:hypothetical protein
MRRLRRVSVLSEAMGVAFILSFVRGQLSVVVLNKVEDRKFKLTLTQLQRLIASN